MRLRFATRAAVLSAVVVCGLAGPAGAQPVPPPPPARPVQGAPPRDPGSRMPPEAVGTGVIRGRVVASDTGNPVRRANVTLIATPPPPPPPSPPPPAGTPPGATMTATATMIMNGVTLQAGGNLLRPKSATTDSQGAFEFTALPAGTYRLTASAGQYSAAYLGIAYGAKKPSGPGSFDQGTPIQLANGQAFDKAVIALPRGAVITGRVTDENGDALARVQVYTMFYQAGSARGSRTGSGGQTDDLGQFRLFGLTPGEYAVVAEARGNTFVQPNAPPETEEDKIGFMTTYYPGSADEGGAQHVRARAGAETPGIEIRMVTGRLFHITGTVMDSQGRPATRISGNLTRRTGNMGSFSFGFATDDQGRFQMRSIPSGTYRIGVRQRPMQFNADGSNTDPGEMASVPLTVGGDVDNLMIITTAGATITGQIVFEQGAPPQMPQAMRVNASFGNPEDMAMGIGTPTAATVSPDLTFTMKGMLGEYLLRTNAPNQYLKSVTLGGEDITDAPREFKTGDRVTLTLTSRASTLEGNVTDAAGKPSTDAGLILFSEDKASWRTSSFRTRRTFVDPYGHYKLTGLMPGRYFVAAVPRDRLNTPPGADATFFEQLAKEATSVVVGEDEQRQADLKVVVMESGGN